jgi:polyphosphate kinase
VEAKIENTEVEVKPGPATRASVTDIAGDAVSDQAASANDTDNPSLENEGPMSQRREPEERIWVEVPKAVAPSSPPEGVDLHDPSLYFNQELSWIDFNWRVLALAMDERTPLLERVRFVAITANNLDEFTEKRIGGLKRQEAAGVTKLTSDGRTPSQQLTELRQAMLAMHATMTGLWQTDLRPALRSQVGVDICDYEDLSSAQRSWAHEYFQREIYPILTPLAVDPGHPFPFISNLSLSVAVILRRQVGGSTHFIRLKIPVARWVEVPVDLSAEPSVDREDGSDAPVQSLLPVEQLIIRHVDDLFPGMDVISAHTFRITRNADVRRDEEEADDLIEMISAELRERRFAPVVRLEVAKEMPEQDQRLLRRELGLQPDDVYEVDGLLDLTDCFQIADLSFPEFKYAPWEPTVPYRVAHEGETKETSDIFAIIRQGDLLVHHPYDSFAATTARLVQEAAHDPNVLAIKQTLYRTSDESPIINALIQAAEAGKQVAVLVEVKARFDEANNIEWGRKLENAGVHVNYGLVGLKTHTKATLVVRRERDGLRTYCHIGTGNYNSKTARLYTDLGLFTTDPAIGRDIVNLFHFLTGYAPDQQYDRVLVAPNYMRSRFNDLVEQEIAFQQEYGTGRIIAKMNAIDDPKMIRRLYHASQAGVQIDLILRGHCCLRPGLPGYSDNIRVVSILGRFLEHDRTYYFHNNGDPLVFFGSADWRTRNLKSRVELITPVTDQRLKLRLIDMLELALADQRLAWDLDADGQYRLRCPAEDEKERDFHQVLMKQARKRAKKPRLV